MRVETLQSTKNTRADLSARSLVALRKYLDQKGLNDGEYPHGLGRAALAGGVKSRELATIHERAVILLVPTHDFTNQRNGSFNQAENFFAQALIPLATAHRTSASATYRRRLERKILRRKISDLVIRKGKQQYEKLLVQSRIMEAKLRELTRQIITAQEEERKEISRELHDEVVQTLVGINVQLSALSRGASVGLGTLKTQIARTQRLVESSDNAVHRFARELRPAVLDDLGLIPALHAYCKNLAARKKIKIQLTAFGGVEALGTDKRTIFYRVAQEALTNVARHARATQVTVSIRKISGHSYGN